jgi:Zn-dependent metalloprotease
MIKHLLLITILLVSIAAQAQEAPSPKIKSATRINTLNDRYPNKKTAASAIPFEYKTVDGRNNSGPELPALVTLPDGYNPATHDLMIKRDATSGLPIMIEGAPKTLKPISTWVEYLKALESVTLLKNSEEDFILKETTHEPELHFTFYRLQQQYHHIPVYGSQLIVRAKNGDFDLMMGNYYSTPVGCDVQEKISHDDAMDVMYQFFYERQITIQKMNAFQRSILNNHTFEIDKIIYMLNDKDAKLAWHILIYPNMLDHYELIIDAANGNIIKSRNLTCSANGSKTASAKDLNGVTRTINTYEYNGDFYALNTAESMYISSASQLPNNPVGAIWTVDAGNTDGSSISQITNTNNTSWSTKAVSAHYNAKVCYDYYKNIHGRNSINGTGGNIISIINVTESGQAMDNAYWNGQAMFYGNGNQVFKPLAGALDVGGHEMTHGVVQNSANLEYQDQAGALNESFADIFGAMIEGNNWQMGEDITKKSYIASGALRDLSNPHNGGSSLSDNGWQPMYMKEYYAGTSDNGGVHTNSGIPNFAYYLFATKVTKAKAEKIYYRALTKYLTSKSKFLNERYAVIQACKDLYTATEEAWAKWAFDSVQIYDPNASGGSGNTNGSEIDLASNSGTEVIVSYDINFSGSNYRWYKSSSIPDNFKGLGTSTSRTPLSTPDNGSKGYFVGTDNKIYSVTLTGASGNETIIQNSAIWDNVAVSKDGSKFAAISTTIDTSIWIYDGSWTKFKLYNPTSANGVNTGGVLYAGSIEWDYTGQYVIYDAYNLIKNNNGADIDYWDVGIIKVWDLKTNTQGNGKVRKVFANLAEGVSIGNPAYSKNSPYIAAFDYLATVGSTTSYSVIASNMIAGTVKTTISNIGISWPRYSRLDNKMLFNTEDNNSNLVVGIINLQSDKMTMQSGTAKIFISDARYGDWITQGTRKLLNGDKDIKEFKFLSLTPAATATISGTNITVNVPGSTDVTKLTPTFVSSPLATVYISTVEQVSGVNSNNFSSSVIYKVVAEDGTSKDYTVTVNKVQLSSAKDILSYSFNSVFPVSTGTINGVNVSAIVPFNTDVTKLAATFQLSPAASVTVASNPQVSGVTINNFTNPLVYTVKAADASTKDYIVTVSKASGVAYIEEAKSFAIYPNPFDKDFTFYSEKLSGKVRLELLDLQGKIIYVEDVQLVSGVATIHPAISSGLYVARVVQGNEVYTVKVNKL